MTVSLVACLILRSESLHHCVRNSIADMNLRCTTTKQMARRSTAAFCYSGQSHDLLLFLSFTVMLFIQYSEICLNTRVFSFTVSGEQACICKAYKQRV